MTSSTASMKSQSPGLKTYFKTPEGQYKLLYEKTHAAAAAFHPSHGRTISKLTIAYLKEKPPNQASSGAPSSSSYGGMRLAASRLWGSSTSSSRIGVLGTGGVNRVSPGKFGSFSSGSYYLPNYDSKGTYLIFNAADTICISDLNSQDKEPIKAIHFSNSNPICHAFKSEVEDGHDLLIGLQSGDVYSVSLRQQLQDSGKKLVAYHHYNKDGINSNSRCTCIAWVPGRDGTFLVGHADGNIYVYEKGKDGVVDCSFPVIRDQAQFGITHARSSKCNPIARWHICQGSINSISFSVDGVYMATVGRDGILRVFDYAREQLLFGGKSYYGALLCCSWSPDGKYILTGGEDDLVQVWSMEEKKIVVWCEGHNSWVSGVSFDSFFSAADSQGPGDNIIYRFGSVGQDTQILLWDLVIDEIAVPLRGLSIGSPTLMNGNHSAHCDEACTMSTLQPSPSMKDVPKLSPLVAHRVHVDPLSGLVFTNESVITISRDGHIKIWARPVHCEGNHSGQYTSAMDTSTTSAISNGTSLKVASPNLFT